MSNERNIVEELAKEQNDALEKAKQKKVAKRTKERAMRMRAERPGKKGKKR